MSYVINPFNVKCTWISRTEVERVSNFLLTSASCCSRVLIFWQLYSGFQSTSVESQSTSHRKFLCPSTIYTVTKCRKVFNAYLRCSLSFSGSNSEPWRWLGSKTRLCVWFTWIEILEKVFISHPTTCAVLPCPGRMEIKFVSMSW